MAQQHKLKITKTGQDCRVDNRKLEVYPGDTVGWHGSNTVGCVVFDANEWPFTEPQKKIDVP